MSAFLHSEHSSGPQPCRNGNPHLDAKLKRVMGQKDDLVARRVFVGGMPFTYDVRFLCLRALCCTAVCLFSDIVYCLRVSFLPCGLSEDYASPHHCKAVSEMILSQEEEVREYWSYCGEIEAVDLMRFPDTGRFKGIAFITFADVSQLCFALIQVHLWSPSQACSSLRHACSAEKSQTYCVEPR